MSATTDEGILQVAQSAALTLLTVCALHSSVTDEDDLVLLARNVLDEALARAWPPE